MRSPLRLGVYLADQNPHRDRSLGISTVTQVILSGLHEDPAFDVTAWTSRSALRPEAPVPTRTAPFPTDRLFTRLLTDALHPVVVPRSPEVWFYPKGFLSPLLPPPRPSLVMIHDTILDHYHRHYPDERSKANYRYWLLALERSLRRATRVATVSHTSRRQIEAFADRRGFTPPPIDVVYAACLFEHPLDAAAPKGNYVLHLASDAPHKRTAALLDVWHQGVRDGRDLPQLVLIGALSDRLRATATGLPHVTVLPRQPADAFVRYYREARAVLVPSEIEGFGLPVLEAYLLGTPACYTRGTSMEEILQPFTDVGGFDLDEPATFWAALDDALAMPPATVAAVRTSLLETYSKERLCANVAAALQRTAAEEPAQEPDGPTTIAESRSGTNSASATARTSSELTAST